ncbi:MAG: LTA synthase family protein [Coriobacteriales bacterium]|nr:LTA synthase family protein [Coriobacteriales bacterium]
MVKYLFSVLLAIYACTRSGDLLIFFISLIEIALVFVLCNELARISRIAASVTSSILLLLFDAQQLFMVFANTYLTLVMFTNVDSLEDLSGKMVVYVTAFVLVVLLIALPIKRIDIPLPRVLTILGGTSFVVFALFCVDAVCVDQAGAGISSFFSYVHLAQEYFESGVLAENLKKQPNTTLEFYKAEVTNYRDKPSGLPKQPNVVVIYSEGISQNIVDDERAIMPNVAAYQAQSLTFDNYFNHTFATYRGLTGQTHSGFQHQNYDENTLVSYPAIFAAQGYNTAFMNVEPYNMEFAHYLATLGFDEVLEYPDENRVGPTATGLSDREAYETLLREMERYSKMRKPFLLGMYTFGTHASFDSMDQKFADGFDTELNKFYDLDYQFGAFMEAFKNSPLYDNTIIVFTADHCTYGDMYFKDAFPNYQRPTTDVDEMPLFIYHKGVVPEVVDVQGRNSLDMAPTLLDYLDMTAENYFLGNSLFAPVENASELEYFFNNGSTSSWTTKGGYVHKLDKESEKAIETVLWHYYAAKMQEPLSPDEVVQTENTSTSGGLPSTSAATVAAPAASGIAQGTASGLVPESASGTTETPEPGLEEVPET